MLINSIPFGSRDRCRSLKGQLCLTASVEGVSNWHEYTILMIPVNIPPPQRPMIGKPRELGKLLQLMERIELQDSITVVARTARRLKWFIKL